MKTLSLAGIAAVLLLVGAGCASTTTTTTTNTTTTDSPVVQNDAPTQKATAYIGDQGIIAAAAAGWTKFENKVASVSGLPSASFYLPKGYTADCTATPGASYTCAITKTGTTTPDAFVVYYLSSYDANYETDGFSSTPTSKQYGYNDGSEFKSATIKTSEILNALTGVSFNVTPVNAFTFSNQETAPYSVLVLDPNANWGIGDWTTFLSTVTLIGQE
jgi:hypothetical protein